MKKILVLSELAFWPCVVCASIHWALFEDSEIEVKFVSEKKFVETTNKMANNYDLIVGVGYKHLIITQELSYKDRVLVLRPSEDNDEFIPIIFTSTLPKNFDLITTIVETANGQINKNICFNREAEEENELAELIRLAQPGIDESLFYLGLRYDCALRVVKTLYEEKWVIKFHKCFFMEMINKEKIAWTEKLLDKHELMEKNTNQLIDSINPLEKFSHISFSHSEDIYFFKDDLIRASENQGYLATTIEYKTDCGQYMTIYAQKCQKEICYLLGQVKDNWSLVISSLN